MFFKRLLIFLSVVALGLFLYSTFVENQLNTEITEMLTIPPHLEIP